MTNEMQTKHQPTTGLPWTTGQMPARWPERDQMYAAFTANAYPKLINTLRYLAVMAEDYAYDGSVDKLQSLQIGRVMAQDLLRELGEE